MFMHIKTGANPENGTRFLLTINPIKVGPLEAFVTEVAMFNFS